MNKPLFDDIIQVNTTEKEVMANTNDAFNILLKTANKIKNEFASYPHDDKLSFQVNQNSPYVFEVSFGSDMLAFITHTEVYTLPKEHELSRMKYISQDKSKANCGVIDIFNFLTSSFKYHRMDDTGALIGRILVNKEKHFNVTGQKELAAIVNKFDKDVFDETFAEEIINAAIKVALHLDIYIPTTTELNNVTLETFLSFRDKMQLRSGKKIGFK